MGALGGARPGGAETELDRTEAVDALAHFGLVRVAGGQDGDASLVALQHGSNGLEVVALGCGVRKAADLVGIKRVHGRVGLDSVEDKTLEGMVAEERSCFLGDASRVQNAPKRGERPWR